jgi:hypothetical protein
MNKLINYYRNEINNIKLCFSIKTNYPSFYIELIDLFKNHPDYPDKLKNVIDISIINNKLNKKYYELQLIKQDGTFDNISYISCIKKPSKDTNLKNAMRYAISNQILEYKNSYEKDNLICETCNSKDEIQVDHVILFKQLYNDFLKQNEINIPTKFDDNYYNSAMFTNDDEPFNKSWCIYHKKHSILRLLCKNCNLKRNKKLVIDTTSYIIAI